MMNEHNHQSLLVAWAWANGLPIFAIPNGGARNPATAQLLKREGVLAGIPDLFLPIPHGGKSGLFLEMKTLTGRTRKAQAAMIELLEGYGYTARVCHGYEAAKAAIREYLK